MPNEKQPSLGSTQAQHPRVGSRLTSTTAPTCSQWEMPGTRQELICAFWKSDSNRRGYWATSGCQTLGSGNGSTTCQCNHLSSFAILMAHYDVEVSRPGAILKNPQVAQLASVRQAAGSWGYGPPGSIWLHSAGGPTPHLPAPSLGPPTQAST